MRATARIAAASLIVLAAVGSHIALQAQAGAPVFLPAGSAAASADARPLPGVTVLRWRLVHIDFAVLAAAQDGSEPERAAQTLLLNLFPDVSFVARVDGRERTFSGGYALRGPLDGVETGVATLVVNGAVVAGTVRTPAATYRIRSVGSDVHVIEQVDLSTLPPGAEPLVPTLPAPDAPAGLAAAAADLAGADDGSVIDVAVFYTPAARAGFGGTAATEAEIDKWVAETNGFYRTTRLTQRIRLVARDEVSHTEGASMIGDLASLYYETDGQMDGVHAVRDEVGADLVHLIVGGYAVFDICGIAFWMDSVTSAFEASAFGVTDYRCAAVTFAHELGHNMGLDHDRYVVTVADRTAGAHPWAFGYVNQRAFDAGAPSTARWITIMAYGRQCTDAGFDCFVVPAFSSPILSYGGDPMGVAGDAPSAALDGPADARRTLEATRRVVANFRRSKVVTPPEPPPPPCTYTLTPTRRYVLPRGGGPFEFTVTASASSCSWTPRTDDDFLHLHTGDSTGSGTVRYSVHPHAGLGVRTGVIRVGDAAFTVTTGPARLLAPEPGGVVSIAAAVDSDLTGLRRWDVRGGRHGAVGHPAAARALRRPRRAGTHARDLRAAPPRRSRARGGREPGARPGSGGVDLRGGARVDHRRDRPRTVRRRGGRTFRGDLQQPARARSRAGSDGAAAGRRLVRPDLEGDARRRRDRLRGRARRADPLRRALSRRPGQPGPSAPRPEKGQRRWRADTSSAPRSATAWSARPATTCSCSDRGRSSPSGRGGRGGGVSGRRAAGLRSRRPAGRARGCRGWPGPTGIG